MDNKFFKKSLGQQIKTLNLLTEKSLNNSLKDSGINLTGTQVAVLMQIYGKNDLKPITQKQIELSLNLSHPTTRGIIKRLIDTGLIETTTAPDDKRQIILYLTSIGKEFMNDNLNSFESQTNSMEQQMLRGITPEEVKSFQKTMQIMITNMKNI